MSNVKTRLITDMLTGNQLSVSELFSMTRTLADYSALGAYTGKAVGVRITKAGIAGYFFRDDLDLNPTAIYGMVIIDGAGRAWKRQIDGVVIDSWFGTKGDGTSDDFVPLSTMFEYCRANGVKGMLAAKTFVTSQPLDYSGCDLEGVLSGFNNVKGTRFKGTGTNKVLAQSKTGASFITYSLKNMAILGGAVGLSMSYAAHCRVENVFVTDCTAGIEAGVAGILGPLWCTFKNVRVAATTGLALSVQGTDFANANIFDTCYFYSAGDLTAKIGTSSGFGAIANKFINTEFAGKGIGVELNRTMSTSFDGAYFETEGPSIHVVGQSLDMSFRGCAYGTLKNNNKFGVPAFIWHEAGGCAVTIDGGTVFLNAGTEYNDIKFMHSSLPTSFTVKMLNPPSRQISASGFALFGDGLPTALCTLNYQASYTPVWTTTGTQPVLGDGVITGSYTLSGRTCTVELTLTAGATTTFGTGQFQISLPFPERSGTPDRANGIARLGDAGTSFYIGLCEVTSGTSTVVFYSNNSPNLVQSNSPFVWAANDYIRATITYEI